jgi:hypothetical protein
MRQGGNDCFILEQMTKKYSTNEQLGIQFNVKRAYEQIKK